MASTTKQARKVFQKHGGTLRTSEALAAGIHPRTLYALRDAGELEQLARGLYRLAGLPPLSEPDLATVAKCIPQGVVCLISALAYHELTTQVPHESTSRSRARHAVRGSSIRPCAYTDSPASHSRPASKRI